MSKWRILFLGDAMCHDNQRELAYSNGSYNFDSSFASLKDLFGEYDYIACNLVYQIFQEYQKIGCLSECISYNV